MFSKLGTNPTSWIGSSWSLEYLYDLVEPSWSLKVTHGEITSIMTVPRCATAAFSRVSNCRLSPEKERATKVAPSWMASAQESIAGRSLMTPVFHFQPKSPVTYTSHLTNPH